MPEPSFEGEIRPLFRETDRDSMKFAFDLSAYEDICEYAEEIYQRLSDESMPCDAPWAEDNIRLFRDWIDTGMQP